MSKLGTIMKVLLVGVLIMFSTASTVWGAVTTDATGQVFQQDWDMTRYAAAGLAGNAVVYYNATTGTFELDDAFVAGAGVPLGLSAGEMLFWDAGAAAWAATTGGAGTNEMYWDDVNKSLGIGNDADDNTDVSFLSIADATFVDIDDFWGIVVDYTKTGGVTTGADWFYGIAAQVNINQAAGTIGDLTALVGSATITDCTAAADAIGLLTGATIVGGTHDDAYGIFSNVDIAAAATTSGGGYGIYNLIDNDNDIATSVWGQLTDVNQVLGAITGNLIGHSIDLDMTATSAANSIGLLNVGTYNGALTITDDILGFSNLVTLTAATLVTDDVIGASNSVLIGDAVGDDVLGISTGITHTAGVITGDVFGVYNATNLAATAACVNVYGEKQELTTDTAATGSIWGELNDVNHVAGAVTGDVRALEVDLDVTGGSAADYYGIKNPGSYTDATVGDDTFGIYTFMDIVSGTFTGDISGVYTDIDQAAAGGGDVFGDYINVTSTSTVAGGLAGEWIEVTNTSGDITGLLMGQTIDVTLTADTVANAAGYGVIVNQDGGVCTGYLIGAIVSVDQDAGTLTDAIGIDLDVGVVSTPSDDVIGIDLDINADAVGDDVLGIGLDANTTGAVAGDFTGIYNRCEVDSTVGGALTGEYVEVANVGATTGNVMASHIYNAFGGGSAVDSYGILNVGNYDDTTISGDIYGIDNQLIIVAGDFTVADDVFGCNHDVDIGDDIVDDFTALMVDVDQTAGAIGGDGYGIHVDTTFLSDASVTTSYGVAIESDEYLDMALYQEGTTVKPLVALTLATGDNDAVNLPNGTHFLIEGPAGAFKIGGITAGGLYDGRMVTIINYLAHNCTIENDEIGAQGDLRTMTGGDLASTTFCSIDLIYDADGGGGGAGAWYVTNFED